MSNFFEKFVINAHEIIEDTFSASSSLFKGSVATQKITKEQKNIVGFKKDVETDIHNIKVASVKPLKKINADQRAIEKELNYLKHRHFFLVNKNKR